MKKGRNQKNFPDERGEGDKKQRDGKLKDGCRMERDEQIKLDKSFVAFLAFK